MSAQEVFDQAYQRYRYVTETLNQFGKILEEVTDGQFDREIALCEYDCILQFILLYSAIADDEISRPEVQFAKQITDYGDIMKMLRARTSLNLDWEDLQGMDRETGLQLLKAMSSVYSEMVNDFCGSVAKADGMIKKIDLLETIRESTICILSCFTCVDGNATDEERTAACSAYLELFDEFYRHSVAEGKRL